MEENINDIGLDEFIKKFEELKKAVSEGSVSVSEAYKQMKENADTYKKSVTDVGAKIDNLTSIIIINKEKQNQLNNMLKEGKISQNEYNKEMAISGQEMARANNDRKNYINIIQSEEGSIKRAKAENAAWRRERNELGKATKENKEQIDAYNEAINKNNKIIGDNVDGLSRMFMGLEKMPGPLGGIINGFMGMAKAAWAFVATPIGAVIAAIVVAVTAIVNVFKKFQPLLDWFEQKIAAVSAVINVVKDAFLGFLSGSKSLAESFKGLGGAMADAATRAIELKKAQQELEDQQNILVESEAKAKRQIDELLLQSKNRTLSEKERIELIDKALKIEEEAFNKKKKMVDDEYDQAVEQIAINNQLTDEQKKNLKEQGAAYLQKLQDTKGIDDEEVKSFAALSAKREEILDESISLREKAMNRQDALIEKQEEKERKRQEEQKKKEDEERQRKEDNDKKILEEHQKYLDAEAEAERVIAEVKEAQRREARDKDREERKKERDRIIEENAINAENEYQLAQLRGQMLFDLDRENLALRQEEEVKAAEKVGADVNQINEKYALLNKKITQEEIKFKLGLASQFAGNLATIFGKNTKVGKLAASAQTAIDTYAGAISAYKSLAGIPYVGPVLGAAAAAAVGVAGAKAIKNIWAVKSGLPGDTGGGSSTTPVTPVTGVANVNPSIGNGIVSRSVDQTGNQINVTTQPTLVVDDVTEAQQRKDRINKTQAL